MELNKAEEIISRHPPMWMLAGYFACLGNGCYFTTGSSGDSWGEFAGHLASELERG